MLLWSSFAALAQQPPVQPILSTPEVLLNYVREANDFRLYNPQEKVYLHFDNTGYYQGDTIWFKAHVVFAENNKPTVLSRILHVELLSPEGDVVESQNLKIQQNGCDGHFALKMEYTSGFYEVRAYTRAMLNFGDDGLFSRVFPVYDIPQYIGSYYDRNMKSRLEMDITREKDENRGKISMNFYPEGGNAVMGISSKVVFQVTDKDGNSIWAHGSVLNDQNEEITRFNTTGQGVGYFVLIPEQKEYQVNLNYGGKVYPFTFDKIQKQGYALEVNNITKDRLLVRLKKSADAPCDTAGFVLACRGRQLKYEQLILGDEPAEMLFNKYELPLGVIQLTLFDKKGNVLAERLAFNSARSDYGSIQHTSSSTDYEPFELVEMDFTVTDAAGAPLNTNFSLAIRDRGSEFQTSYEDNVLTDLLLSSELKGYIENPMQYFVNDDSKTLAKLDLLMLVQGWRRYNWQVMAGVVPFDAQHYAEEGLPIAGKVLNASGRKARTKSEVMIWLMFNGETLRGSTPVNDDGSFYFNLPDDADVFGECLLGLQVTENGKRKDSRITLDRWFSPQARAYTNRDVFVGEDFAIAEDNLPKGSIEKVQMLAGVAIQSKIKTSGFGQVFPDIVYDVKRDINKEADLGEWYPGTVQQYLISRGEGLFDDSSTCREVDTVASAFQVGTDSYVDDVCFSGRPVYICTCLESVPDSIDRWQDLLYEEIETISKIDVFYKSDMAWLLVARAGTAIDRTPDYGDAVFVRLQKYDNGMQRKGYISGVRYTPYYGYAQSAEFYHVNNREKQLKGGVDFRRTLYWNPNVQTDVEGKAKVKFYNNGTCLRMSISAEGISSEGLPVIGG